MTKLKNVGTNLTEDEIRQLKDFAKKTGLTVSALLRALVRGYRPKEKPDERFYAAMRQLEDIADGIRRLADSAHGSEGADAQMLSEEVARWHRFQAEIERYFLRPEEDRRRWQ